jgi:hypothetical protein
MIRATPLDNPSARVLRPKGFLFHSEICYNAQVIITSHYFGEKEEPIVSVMTRARRHPEQGYLKTLALFVLLAFCSAVVASPLFAQDSSASGSPAADASTGTPSGVGMQAASAVATILYFPFKAAFAIGGGVVGGLAYAFSGGSEQTAKNIWIPSIYGTYIITPDHLKGDKPVRFLGVPAEPVRDAEISQEPAPMRLEPTR